MSPISDRSESSPERLVYDSESSFSTPGTERSLPFDEIPGIPIRRVSGKHQHILVVGGLGYIGSHTTWELLKEGCNVIIVDNLSNSYRKVFETLQTMTAAYFKGAKCPSLRFFEADFRDIPAMKSILTEYAQSSKFELDGSECSYNDSSDGNIGDSDSDNGHRTSSSISGVIHFAGYKSVSESIAHPLRYYANNVSGLVEFCTLLSDFDIKTLVFSSSAVVYGELANLTGRVGEELCVHKTTAFIAEDGSTGTTAAGCTGLTNPYGRTKWMCEAILNDVAVADPEWTIIALRYFNPIGCDESGLLGEDPRSTPNNLMPVIVKVLMGEQPYLNVFGTDWDTRDGTAIRDFIHVADLASGHIAALTAASKLKLRGGFQTFNLGSGKGHTVLETVHAMETVSGKSIPIRARERRNGDVAVCVATTIKAEQELGWKAKKTLYNCCADICRFLGLNVVESYT